MKARRIAGVGMLAVLLGGAATLGAEARIGSWGDQGDGTYRNPVLNANYPDSDVEQAGDYTVIWNGDDESGRTVASGVYHYRLESDDYVKTRKMLLLK